MKRQFCLLPEEVAEWLNGLADDERTTTSEILRRILVSLHDDYSQNTELLVESGEYTCFYDSLADIIGPRFADFKAEAPTQSTPPYYLLLASGVPGAIKRTKLWE